MSVAAVTWRVLTSPVKSRKHLGGSTQSSLLPWLPALPSSKTSVSILVFCSCLQWNKPENNNKTYISFHMLAVLWIIGSYETVICLKKEKALCKALKCQSWFPLLFKLYKLFIQDLQTLFLDYNWIFHLELFKHDIIKYNRSSIQPT